MLPLLYTETQSYLTERGLRVVRVVFAGEGGAFSEGQLHGNQMRDVIRQAVERDQPSGVIIDVRQLKYPGGDWIIWGCLFPGKRRTCLVAAEQTLECLREILAVVHLDPILPVFSTLEQAEEYVRSENK